jgi:hypothetical protein
MHFKTIPTSTLQACYFGGPWLDMGEKHRKTSDPGGCQQHPQGWMMDTFLHEKKQNKLWTLTLSLFFLMILDPYPHQTSSRSLRTRTPGASPTGRSWRNAGAKAAVSETSMDRFIRVSSRKNHHVQLLNLWFLAALASKTGKHTGVWGRFFKSLCVA